MKMNSRIKVSALPSKHKERQSRSAPRGLKIKSGVKAGMPEKAYAQL